jgi:hypothetical protein
VKRGRSADWRTPPRSVATAMNVDPAKLRLVDVAKKYGSLATSAAPPATATSVNLLAKKARNSGKHEQTLVDVRAVIDLVDLGRQVIEAAREIVGQRGQGETQAKSLARTYRRRHRDIRKEMAAAQQMSADAAARKRSAVRSSAAVKLLARTSSSSSSPGTPAPF